MNMIARFLPNLIPGLGAFFNPWVILVAIGLAAAGFGTGVYFEGLRWDASLKDIADANIKIIQGFYQRDNAANAVVSTQLSKDRAKLDKDRSDFQRNLKNAKRERPILTVKPSPDAPGPASGTGIALRPAAGIAVCDSRCIGLYHDGLNQGLPAAYGAWRADADAGAPASVEADDLIDNAGENFALGNKFRSQILGWQRLACSKGWWVGKECDALRKE